MDDRQQMPPVSAVQRESLLQLVDILDEELRAAGAGSAENAFGLGCGIGLLPVALVLVLMLLSRRINFVLAILLAVILFIALVGVSTLLAYQARKNAILRRYQQDIEPRITLFCTQQQLTRLQFDTLAASGLPEGAPLQDFLTPLVRANNDEDDALD